MPKETPKKTTTKKTAAKKATSATTAATPKTTTTKRKTSPKTTLKTSIAAYVDVGFGNTLYIRGEGAGLSWEKGMPLENVSPTEWTLDISKAKGAITFKFLINDQVWAEGDNLTIEAGSRSISSPQFVW